MTSLAPDEAMRILGSERRGTVQAAAALLRRGLPAVSPRVSSPWCSACEAVAAGVGPGTGRVARAARPGDASLSRAQYPEPSAAPVITTGDPRSDGGGPGLVGSPIEIALAVVLLGSVTVAGTVLVLRLTRR